MMMTRPTATCLSLSFQRAPSYRVITSRCPSLRGEHGCHVLEDRRGCSWGGGSYRRLSADKGLGGRVVRGSPKPMDPTVAVEPLLTGPSGTRTRQESVLLSVDGGA